MCFNIQKKIHPIGLLPCINTDHPILAQELKRLRKNDWSLGFYKLDGSFHILREVYLKGGVMYCVENRERMSVSNLLSLHNSIRRPRWIHSIYLQNCWKTIRLQDYLEKRLTVKIY